MKIKIFFGVLGILAVSANAFAYPLTPRATSNLTASQDVLASSSDTHSVGDSSNVWRNGYFSYLRLSNHAPSSTNISSFGYLYVSVDSSLRYRKANGSETVIVA